MVTESGLLISPTSEWDLKQRRIWPPVPYQAYCEKHFIHECLVYYSLEMEKLEEEHQKNKEKNMDRNQASEAETLPSITASSREATQKQQPTRVQPGRRAKGSSATAWSETRAIISSRRRTHQELSDSEYEGLKRRQELCLELSWAEFQAKLKALIKRSSKKLSRKQAKKSSPHNNGTTAPGGNQKGKGTPLEAGAMGHVIADGDHCPLWGLIKVGCRYCDHRPEVSSSGGGGSDDDADHAKRSPPPPNRGAPVAPMHILGEADFSPDQKCTLGGLTFAVDVCGGAESVSVILIEMRSLDLEREDGEKDGRGDAGSVPKLPAQHSNKRAKTGKQQENSGVMNWIPEEETG